MNTSIITKEQLLQHWQGHRFVTRRVIEKFPEKEFFEFTIGGMRPCAELVSELLAIAVLSLKAIVSQDNKPYNEDGFHFDTKSEFLQKWDETTEQINTYWAQIPEEDFDKNFNLFGQYDFPIYQNILYFIDNEIHHRGQAFVYLRALGIEPPFFWERW